MSMLKTFASIAVVLTITASMISSFAFADENNPSPLTIIAEGKILAFDKKKGNCLACHAMRGGKLPGNIGPPLINMGQRYPNPAFLRAQIEDATENNPNSIMPPYIKHKILTESELDKVIAFIYSL